MSSDQSLSRRAAIRRIGAATVAACAGTQAVGAQEYRPQEQLRLTKVAARYQDEPKRNESCASCPYFIQPSGCVTVEGPISPNGWCPMYTQFSPMDRGAHL